MGSMHLKQNSFNIIGGGLIGLQIAHRLSTNAYREKNNVIISLYDQGDSILRSWDSKICGVNRVNNGFHGIEFPRALSIQAFLEECNCKAMLMEIPNIRSLNIEGEHIVFDACLSDWPNWLSEGLTSLKHVNTSDASQEVIIHQAISSTKLGQLISATYDRFADTLDECWHLFFPWFFPSDFKFPPGDEGNDFQNKVRSNQVKSSYLMPNSFVFEDLKCPIHRSLQMNGVNFIFNKELNLAVLKELSVSSDNNPIWCASSFSLLQALNPDLAKRCISSKRHMHLITFSINTSLLHKLRNISGNLPSEILCLDAIAPELNRLSFLDYSASNSLDCDQHCILLAECFTKTVDVNDDLFKRLSSCLSRFFAADLNVDGYSYARPTFSLSPQPLVEATHLIRNFSSDYSISIPEIYFGPVNMAKCAKIAQSFAL
jgi:hypothetical protein